MKIAVLDKLSAWVLVVLTLLPFTAPFPACDFSSLSTAHVPGGDRPTTNLLGDDSYAHALLLSSPSPRIRFVPPAVPDRDSDGPPLSPPRRSGAAPRFSDPLDSR
jgi:hypothetical protein